MISRWIITTLALAGLAGGGILLYKTTSRAVEGDAGAFWVLTLFGLSLGLLVLMVRKFWAVVIDHSDALDVFRDAASRLGAEPRHFRADHKIGSLDITESGYEFGWTEHRDDIRVQLFQIGKLADQERIRFDEHTLLTLRISTERPLDMAILHPTVDITESMDIERYAPVVLSSHSYSFVKHGVVFSNDDKSTVAPIFDSLFIQNLLAEIFYHYRFKFLVFQNRYLLAIKSVIVESLEQDIESYKLFINLKDLIEEHHKKYVTI